MTAVRSIESYALALSNLLPRGRAWAVAGGRVWQQLMRALAPEFRRTDERLLQLIEEADPRTCSETLTDWERVLALPDPCAPANTTVEERRNAVITLLRSQGGASIAYFKGLAADRGYEIDIREHRPFVCGRSPCGHQTMPEPIGSPLMRFYWTVILKTSRLVWFRTGTGGSQSGVDTHLTIERADEIECLFERHKPSQTHIIFDYSETD